MRAPGLRVGAILFSFVFSVAAPVEATNTYGPIRQGENLWDIARQVYLDRGATRFQVMLALLKANPLAFSAPCNVNSWLQAGVSLQVPSLTAVKALSADRAKHVYELQARAWRAHLQTGQPLLCPPPNKSPTTVALGTAPASQQHPTSGLSLSPSPPLTPREAQTQVPTAVRGPAPSALAAQPPSTRRPHTRELSPATSERIAPPASPPLRTQAESKSAPARQELLDWLGVFLILAAAAGSLLWTYRRRPLQTEGHACDHAVARVPSIESPTTHQANLPEGSSQGPPAGSSAKHGYLEILKSSVLIGGSSVVTIIIGIVRTKAMAVLLGPSGFGLLSLYNSITNLVQSIAEMGINSSGVRQIAEAVGSADNERVARTTTVLRRVSVLLGVFGAALLILFAKPLSALTFGNEDHAGAVALMSLAVLFSCISGGQGALIQGMRRIRDLAKMGVLGALYGTIISIPLVYLLGTRGIALSIVSVAGMGIFTSWWYSRKVRVQVPSMSASEIWWEVLGLLKLGFAFMASALLMTGSAYAVRLILTHEAGFASAGFYQAAWTLGGLYVGFILQAMGADFYPRLTGVATDNSACNRMVNEQTLVSLLLAGPGIIATLTFAPVVIALFYSPQFAHAVDILRWLCLGMALRVISWPIGFILLAKGAQGWFLWSDVAWTIVHLGLAWICVKSFGAVGAGVAFFGSYVFHAIVNYFIVRMLSGFRWSKSNIRLAVVFASSIAVVFSCFRVLEPLVATVVGTLVVVLSSIYSVRTLINVIGLDQMPPAVRRLLAVFKSRAAACSQE